MPTRAACAGSEVPASAPPRRSGTARPYLQASSFRPITRPRTHWTPSPCGRLSRPPWWRVTATTTTGPPPRPDGNSGRCACPNPNYGLGGHRDASHVHSSTGQQGRRPAYPEGIVARYRNPARDLDRPNKHRTAKMVLNSNHDQAPQQPTAASFRAEAVYRGFKHWFLSYAFLPRYRTRPAGGEPLLDRQGLLPPSTTPLASGCPSASRDRYGGWGRGLSPRPVIWRLVAQFPSGRPAVAKVRGRSAVARPIVKR
jgi:hypothetical protein